MVICLERGAELHTDQLMPLPLTVSCFSKIQTGFTFLVPGHPGSPGQRAVKRARVCVYNVLNQIISLQECTLKKPRLKAIVKLYPMPTGWAYDQEVASSSPGQGVAA